MRRSRKKDAAIATTSPLSSSHAKRFVIRSGRITTIESSHCHQQHPEEEEYYCYSSAGRRPEEGHDCILIPRTSRRRTMDSCCCLSPTCSGLLVSRSHAIVIVCDVSSNTILLRFVSKEQERRCRSSSSFDHAWTKCRVSVGRTPCRSSSTMSQQHSSRRSHWGLSIGCH